MKWVLGFVGGGLQLIQEFSSGELQACMKNDMDVNIMTRFARGVLRRSKFLGQPQTLEQEAWLPENSNSRRSVDCCCFFFSFLFAKPTFDSNNLILG